MPVNAEGEPTQSALSREELEAQLKIAVNIAQTLQGQINALVNAITCLTIRSGGDVSIPKAELDGISGYRFSMKEDEQTKAVLCRAEKKSAAASALTAAQELDNRRAEEIALPKGGLTVPSRRLILPP